MKKILFLTVIAFCASFSVKAQDIVNLRMDRQQMGLRGYVATMDEDILIRKDYFREDWPERKWFVKDLRNVLSEDNGRIVTFNEAGRMTSITYTYQGKQGKKTNCTYASNGLLSAFVGEGYKVTAKYNGNMADINVYAETKDYKPSVNLRKADLNTAPYTNVYPFDLKCRQELGEDGLVLNSNYFYVDSMPAKICKYDYNHMNLLMSERVEDYTSGEKDITTVRYTYDNRGFLTKKVLHSRALDETTTYENNELGDCTKMTVERPYGTVVYTFEYVYDSMDNWTVRLEFEDGIFDNAAVRTLTYHKEPKEKKSAVKESKKERAVSEKKADKDKEADLKKAEKERQKAEKQAAKEAEKQQKAAKKAQEQQQKELEKNLSKEEQKALKAQRKAEEKAAKERAAAQKKAEKEMAAAQKKAEKERLAAEKRGAKEMAAAEKRAAKERKAAEKRAEKERKAAEKGKK
ncbi:MAG: hypothetical protein IKN84_00975 [Bacteroidales bacterium]|nr:hypothetical protein [Bacteroidales bacterium]